MLLYVIHTGGEKEGVGLGRGRGGEGEKEGWGYVKWVEMCHAPVPEAQDRQTDRRYTYLSICAAVMSWTRQTHI